MEIEVIGLDLDGTLYEETPEIRKRVRKKIYEKLSLLCGISETKAKELFEKYYEKLLSGTRSIEKITKDHGVQTGDRNLIQEALEEADILDLIKPNLALVQMLNKLSRKKYLDLITGSNKELTIKKITKMGISLYLFTHILTSEDGSKTTGKKYLKWIRLRNLKPEELLYVGDNEKQDIDVPKSLGIQTCIIGEYKNADFQIKNILDLENILVNSH